MSRRRGDYDDAEEGQPRRVREFPAFEQHYGLPPNINLEADPDLALQHAEANPVVAAPPEPRRRHHSTRLRRPSAKKARTQRRAHLPRPEA